MAQKTSATKYIEPLWNLKKVKFGSLMSEKKISRFIVIIVIIVIISVGSILYFAMFSPLNEGNTPDIERASSLQLTVTAYVGGATQGTYLYLAKNIGTSNMMMRIETTINNDDIVYILIGAQRKVWFYVNGKWEDRSDVFASQWEMWKPLLEGYIDDLAGGWTGAGDWTYYAPNGVFIRIEDIIVNPSLADSIFLPG